MRKQNVVLAAALSALLVLLVAGGAAAQTSPPWMSYSPPESFFMGLDAAGSYQYYRDQFTSTEGDVNYGTLKLRFWQFMDSPTFGYDINAALTLQTKGAPGADGEDTTIDFDLNSGGHTSVKYYFTPENDTFGYFGITGTASGLDRYSLVGNLGVGYGRFKDATPLQRAAEIERALMDLGDVAIPFGPGFLISLAQETERVHEAEETSAERAERVSDFIIANAPGSPVLSPAGVITVNDLLNKQVMRRSVGWEVRAGLGYPIIIPADETRSVQAVASASLGMPIAFYTQVNVTAQASSPIDNLASVYTVGVQGEVVHTFNENLDVGANATLNLSGREGDESIVSWGVGAFADVQIIEGLSLVTTATYRDETRRNDVWEQAAFGITASVRYRFF